MTDWVAQWVAIDEPQVPPKGERPAHWVRGVVVLPAGAPARARVTALGLYELFVNGTRVGDAELTPGFTQYAARVPAQVFDISDLVVPGANVVALLVSDGWYRGQVGAPRTADQFGSRLAVRLQVESAGSVAGTDARGGWRSATSHILAADLIGGQHEDRRLLDRRMHRPDFDASSWRPVVEHRASVAIVEDAAPPVRRVQELRPRSVHRLVDGAQIVDLGQNINGWVRLLELGPAGSEIVLRHGEHLTAEGDLTTSHLDVDLPILPAPLPLGQVDRVVSAGLPGDVFEPRMTTHGFRYVRIEGHQVELTPDDVVGVVVHSDLERLGDFTCSDARIVRLHEAAVWSLRGNICGVPTDCPQRERAGWTGDWQVFAPTAAYLYDVLAFTRSWLRDVALDQRADGCVANMSPCPPAEGFDSRLAHLNGSAGWGDVVVSAPWDLYWAYGDADILQECWPVMRAWLDFATTAARSGRHPDRAAARPEPAAHERYLWDTGFHWGEWLEPGAEIADFGAFARADKSEVATAYLHRSAATMAAIATVLGLEHERAELEQVADGARRAWQAEYVDADGQLVVRTQAAHVRALAFGLVEEEQRGGVADDLARLVSESGQVRTGFLSTGLLLGTLAETGHLREAYDLLLRDAEPSWLTMIARGATTMWESWNGVDGEGHAHGSLNHYAKGAVISFLHRHVAGLSATSPGYRTFRVQPRPGGGLTSAATTHRSRHGEIAVSWEVSGERFTLEVDVPPGTSASIVLPDGSEDEAGPGHHVRGCSLTSARRRPAAAPAPRPPD